MTTSFFRDPEKQDQFKAKGYAIIPFLNSTEVNELKTLYASLNFVSTSPSLCSVIGERPAVALELREEFVRIGAQAIDRAFLGCELLLANFLVKRPGPATVTRPHQDWTITDATRHLAGVAWVPLDDVDAHNGVMGAIPGSHTVFPDICCAPSAYGYRLLPYTAYAMDLFPYLNLRPLKAGEALVFSAGVVHGSVPNRSSEQRVVSTFSLAQAGTEFRLPYLLPGTDLSKYELFKYGADEFVQFDNTRLTALYDAGSRPAALESFGVYDLQPTRIGAKEAIARLEAIGCRRMNNVA